jgi:hypothetical protein
VARPPAALICSSAWWYVIFKLTWRYTDIVQMGYGLGAACDRSAGKSSFGGIMGYASRQNAD